MFERDLPQTRSYRKRYREPKWWIVTKVCAIVLAAVAFMWGMTVLAIVAFGR